MTSRSLIQDVVDNCYCCRGRTFPHSPLKIWGQNCPDVFLALLAGARVQSIKSQHDLIPDPRYAQQRTPARTTPSEVGTTMSDNTERPATDPMFPLPPKAGAAYEAEANPPSPPSNHANDAAAGGDLREALKQRLEETRLPAELKAQILAELPPPEEQERMYRALQEQGGLSAEEFFASLGLEVPLAP